MAHLSHSSTFSPIRIRQISTSRKLRASPAFILTCALACSRTSNPPAAVEKSKVTSTDAAPIRSEPKDTTTEVPTFDLLAFGRQQGQIAPCGCTSDPLGGLDFAMGYLQTQSTKASRLVVEPGSLLFPDPNGPYAVKERAAWAQAQERASLLHQSLLALGDDLAVGLGPTDYESPDRAGFAKKWPLPRLLSNAKDPSSAVEIMRRHVSAEGIESVVAAVVDPSWAGKTAGFPAVVDPKIALDGLFAKIEPSVDLRVLIVEGPRELALSLVDAHPELDVVIAADHAHDPDAGRLGQAPILRAKTWVLTPGEQAQTLSHLRIYLPPAVQNRLREPGSDGLPSAETWQVIASASQNRGAAERLRERLEKFKSDPAADPSFIKKMEAELANLSDEGGRPAGDKLAVRIEQVKVSCRLPSDPAVKSKLKAYDQWVSTENAKRFAGVFAPKTKAGQAHYVGREACSECHEEAVAFWQTTVHAKAYATLVEDNKEYDLACVGCHVTGFRQPGGSEVVENLKLRDVQCEQCHGPASKHVESQDSSDVLLQTPVETCLECHTPEHSDTFELTAYMRDILGPGHGESARKALGDGPTGHLLRESAVKKAGGSCKKM
jgi:hypothetical protein